MPFFLIALLILGATVAFSFLTRKSGKTERKQPAALGDFNFPTATEVRPIPVVVGKIKHKAPNCIWYGDLKSEPIYQKVPNPITFGLTKKKVETGQYRYYVGMTLALCHGLTRLREFLIDDKSVWIGDLIEGSIQFDKSQLFGGETKEGGYAGTFDFYGGSSTQNFNQYLQAQNPGKKMPHHRGISYIQQRGASSGGLLSSATQTFNYILSLAGANQLAKVLNGYVGVSPNLRAYSFILQRNPDHLGQSAKTVINDGDANPIEWLYEVLTNEKYGMGIAPEMISTAHFQAAATVCFNEKLGCSVLWDTSRPCQDVVNDIINLVDGACFQDRSLGLWVIVLSRFDYVIANLPEFNETNITSFDDYGVNTLDEAPNHFIVPYVDKANGYKERNAEFKNLAMFRVTGGEAIAKDLDFYGVADPDEAAYLAFRDAKNDAIPLAKANFKTNRAAHWVRPLSVFKYSRASRGIAPIVMRCIKVDDGKLYDGEISIECLQDVFSITGVATFTPPSPSGWQQPITNPAAAPNVLISEQPFLFAGESARLWAFAMRAGANVNFDLYVSENGGATYAAREHAADFAPVGTLLNDYAITSAIDGSGTLIITFGADMNRLASASPADIQRGANLAMIQDSGEIIGFETITDNGNGTATLNNVWRGLLDTTVQKHAANSRVWFFSNGQSLPEENYSLSQVLQVKIVPNAFGGALDPNTAAANAYTIKMRALRPISPALITIGGVLMNQSIPANSENIVIAWRNRNRITQTQILKQSDASITPETGQTTTIEVRKGSDNSLLKKYEDLIGASFNYTPAMQADDLASGENQLNFVVYASRSGVNSFQATRINTARSGAPSSALPPYAPNDSGFELPPADSPNSIGGLPITNSPSGAGNEILVTDGNGGLHWVPSAQTDNETLQDMIAAFLQAGAGIAINYDDPGNHLSIATTINAEFVDDRVAALLQTGVGIQLDYNDSANTLTISGAAGTTLENVQDNFGNSFLQVGSALTKVYDDSANTLTLGVDLEAIKTLITAFLQAGEGILISFDSGSNQLFISSKAGSLFRVLESRRVVSLATDVLITNQAEAMRLPFGAEFLLQRLGTNRAARVRIYQTEAARIADIGRDGAPDGSIAGLILEAITTPANLSLDLSPMVRAENADGEPRGEVYATIENKDSAAGSVEIDFGIVVLIEGGAQLITAKTAELDPDEVESGAASLGKSFELASLSTSAAARVRIYQTAAARDLDLDRVIGEDAASESGLIFEGITQDDNLSIVLNPKARGANLESSPDELIAYSITNLSASASAIVVKFSRIILER